MRELYAPPGRSRRPGLGLAVAFEPNGDLLARPLVVVVEVHDQRRQEQTLGAAVATGAGLHRVEAVEEPVEVASRPARFLRQPVHRLPRRAERARRAVPVFFSQGLVAPDLSDVGLWKGWAHATGHSQVEGTPGAEIVPELAPHPVLPKWLYLPETADGFERVAQKLVSATMATRGGAG